MSAIAYLARFTPISVESRRTTRGAAQLKSRGVIENRNGAKMRTVVAYGRLHDIIAPKLEVGRTVLLKGYYKRVENADGSLGGEFFQPFVVVRVFDKPVPPAANDPRAPANDTGRTVKAHDRDGHWRWQMCGKGRTEKCLIWVRSCRIHGGQRAD